MQWAHYADKHKGICLGFDVTDNDFLIPVTYSSKRLSKEADKIINGSAINQELMLQLLTTKFYHWHYEKEHRGFIRLKDRDKDGFYYSGFSDKLMLKQIIVGSNSDITRANISKALGNNLNEVEIFKARSAFNSFRVVRNKNEALWT